VRGIAGAVRRRIGWLAGAVLGLRWRLEPDAKPIAGEIVDDEPMETEETPA
jgi:hypothetical protein